MAKICIITQTHLQHNPRVVKEANTLQAAGYEVQVLTAFTSPEKLKADECLNLTGFGYHGVIRLFGDTLADSSAAFWYRLSRRAGILLFKFARIASPYSLAYGPYQLYKKAKSIAADLYIGHSEVGLWVCNKLAQDGKKVAYDFEDWYSKDYISQSRPIFYLKQLEAAASQNAVFVVCPSKAMAAALREYYRSSRFTELYNSFPEREKTTEELPLRDRKNSTRISYYWFSQTVGPGRGLELLMDALSKFTHPFELHLRGRINKEYQQKLLKRIKLSTDQEVFFHAPVSLSALEQNLQEHDVGLALELNDQENKDLTLSNKALQYLQGGLPLICSDTKGQKEIAQLCSKHVFLYEQGKVESLLMRLNQTQEYFLQKRNPSQMQECYQKYFSWGIQEAKLLNLVATALNEKS